MSWQITVAPQFKRHMKRLSFHIYIKHEPDYKHEPRETGHGGGVATIYSDILNVTQKTGYRFNSFRILMLNVKLSDMQNKSVLSLVLVTIYRPPGPYTDFLKEFADFLSDLLVNVDKALIEGDFNIHIDNTNDALVLAFTDLINYFGVKQNVTGPTHRFNNTLDLITSHGIDLTDIDIVPQSDDVTDHFLVSCMLHMNDFNYMAPRYRPIIVPATKDRFTNNLPDLSQLLYVPITTDELDRITSNMGTIFSNKLETVAPIKLKKVREKRSVPWYNSYTHSLKKETRNLELLIFKNASMDREHSEMKRLFQMYLDYFRDSLNDCYNKNVQFDTDHIGMLKVWADSGEDSVKSVLKMTMFKVWQLMWRKLARDGC